MNRSLFFILLFTLILRLGMLHFYGDHLTVDTDAYLAHAEGLVEGRGYSKPGTGIPTAYRPPLLPFFYATILWCGGGPLSIGAIQLLLGCATVWLTWRLSMKLGLNDYAWLPALIVAMDPLLLFSGVSLMTEMLFTFLLLVWLNLIYSKDFPKGTLEPFLSGLLVGLLALCRPTIWSFVFLFILWKIFDSWRVATASHSVMEFYTDKTKRLRIVLCLLGTLLVVTPWLARNKLQMDRYILTTTHGGYTLYLGNNPRFYDQVVSKPWGTLWPSEDFDKWQSSIRSRTFSFVDHPSKVEIDRDQWFYQETKSWVYDQPWRFLQATRLKIYRFWNPAPLTPMHKYVKWSIRLFYLPLFFFLIAGLIFLNRQVLRDWAPLLLLLVSFSLVHSIYWSNMRMRTPLEPILALLATFGWIELRKRFSGRIERKDDRSGQSVA